MNKCLFIRIFTLILLFCSACAEVQTGGTTNSSGVDKDVATHYRFSDVPVPGKFQLDRDKSFVYETGNSKLKIGRLFYSGSKKIEEVATFYQNEMVNHGWVMVRTIEHSGATMIYEKAGWTCLVTLSSSSFGQTTVEIQLGPK